MSPLMERFNKNKKNQNNIDGAIQSYIDQIWNSYDMDRSGSLDKEEAKKFVQDTLRNVG